MITYNVFQPMGNIAWPPFPVKAQILKPDGSFHDVTLMYARDLVAEGEAVAIKFIRPDPVTEKTDELMKTLDYTSLGVRVVIERVVAYMLKDQEKVDVNLTTEQKWLNTKLDKMGYHSKKTRQAIYDWYFDPANHPSAPMENNSLLTVKPVSGGRVIVLPSGHTISYTMAQKIWWSMNGADFGSFRDTTVGEFNARYNRIRHTSTHRVDVNKYRVKVGCQTVDRGVIAEFAQRQGWTDKPPYGAY
jgi:hypothetical protein